MTAAITDFDQFSRMRMDVRDNDPAVLREVAGQFEALFVQTLLKNMRSSSLGDPIFGQSDQFEMYQGMLDQQFAVEMSKGRGIGVADMLVRQLGGGETSAPQTPQAVNRALPAIPSYRALRPFAPTGQPAEIAPRLQAAAGSDGTKSVDTRSVDTKSIDTNWTGRTDFARDVWPHAVRAGETLGIAPEALLAQAALETGWGEHVMRLADGNNSFNLLGIKSSPDWQGATVSKSTLEFRGGVAQREQARFRAYPDLASAFDDYAAFIGSKSRYASVIGSGSDTGQFASALQEAGYATDPNYANKIERIVNGNTMRDVLEALKGVTSVPASELVSQLSQR